MTGEEHYDAAEQVLARAERSLTDATANTIDEVMASVAVSMAKAQVHATLALAAAVGRPPVITASVDADIEGIGIDEAALTRALRELDRREGRRR